MIGKLFLPLRSNLRAHWLAIAVCAGATIIYGLLSLTFAPELGPSVGVLAILPVVAASWFFGVPGGLAASLLSFLLNTLLLNLDHYRGWDVMLQYDGGLEPAVLLLTGVVIGRLSDVTRELQKSEIRYRLLVERSPIAICMYDLVTRSVIEINPAFCSLLGYTLEESRVLDIGALLAAERGGIEDLIERLRTQKLIQLDLAQVWRRKDGSSIDVYVTANKFHLGRREIICLMAHDITANKRADRATRRAEQRYRALFEEAPVMYVLTRLAAEGPWIEDCNELFLRTLGYERAEVLRRPLADFYPAESRATLPSPGPEGEAPGDFSPAECGLLTRDGRRIETLLQAAPETDAEGNVVGIRGMYLDITDRKQREREREALITASAALRTAVRRSDMPPIILDQIVELLDAAGAALLTCDPNSDVWLVELARGEWQTWISRPPAFSQSLSQSVCRTGQPYLNNDVRNDPEFGDSPDVFDGLCAVACVPLIAHERTLGVLWVGRGRKNGPAVYPPISASDMRLLTAVVNIAANAFHRATLYEQTEHRANEFAVLYETALGLTQQRDLPLLLDMIVERAEILLNVTGGMMYLYDPARNDLELTVADGISLPIGLHRPFGEGIAGRVAQTRSSLVVDDYQNWEGRTPLYDNIPLASAIGVPMLSGGELIGVLGVFNQYKKRRFTDAEEHLLTLFASLSASVVQNARLLTEDRRRLQRMEGLHNIDAAIAANLDIQIILSVLLEEVLTNLGVHAADILLMEPHSHTLEYAAGRGFYSNLIRNTKIRLGEGLAGKAALNREILSVPDLNAEAGFSRQPLLVNEHFSAYYAAPLIAKGQIKGVLELFHRAPLEPDREWFDFLQIVSEQAAIAIDNASLFQQLQQSHIELSLAYDVTLEGWSRALELRDIETQGHTQRVTEITIRLARAMEIKEADLIHVRRGALLHDIGKMGIPDSILLKPGPLTHDEWAIMRMHPIYAYELLSPIAALQPALDIPYSHHEKWDGTGYPRRLKGAQIPLAARIFAIADVWDALRSDRPYRQGWPADKVRQYIIEQGGQHFDPEIVEAFLRESKDWDNL